MLFHICCKIILDKFWYLSIGNLDKLLRKQSKENITKIVTPVFLVTGMYIGLTRFLEDGALIVIYDINKRFLGGRKSVNWDNNRKIDKVLAIIDKKLSEEKIP